MATYNSQVYAQVIGQPSTSAGAATPTPQFTDNSHNGGLARSIIVGFDCTLQNLAIGDVINVAVLEPGVIVRSVRVVNTAAIASGTVQMGVAGTPGYFSTAGLTTASAASTDAFTNFANYNTPTTASTTVIATIAGAAMTTGKLIFLIEYVAK